MKKAIIALGLALSLMMTGQAIRAEEAGNLLKNPGFEDIEPYTVPEKWQQRAKAPEMPTWWGINLWAYPGNLTVIYDAITSHSGSKYVKVEGYRTRKQGGAHLFYTERPAVSPDKRYIIKVWAKGKGAISLGFYGYSKAWGGGKFIPGFGSGWMEVNSPDNWKEYKFEFDVKSKPEIKALSVYFGVTGTIYLDDAYFGVLSAK